MGRYIEVDPIGLDGGLNVFGYAEQNPVLNYDPDGLQIVTPRLLPLPPLPNAPAPRLPRPYLIDAYDALYNVVNPPKDGAKQETGSDEVCNNNQPCPPCKLTNGGTVTIGQIAYRYDVLPESTIQHGIAGSHLNLYKANQNPNNCKCFWQPVGAVAPPPNPNWIPIQPFAN